jgi:hypothetical protein
MTRNPGGRPSPDLTWLRFGRLVVTHRLPNSGRRSLWACQCDCGKTAAVLGQNLTRGKAPTRSCGCIRQEAVITNMHRMRAARNAQLSKLREARAAGIVKAQAAATVAREDFRVRAAREERERQAAALDLQACLGYPTGGE